MLPTITADTLDVAPGGEIILRHQTWDDYEALLKTRQDRAAIKVRFSSKTSEILIMAPLPRHGKQSATLTDLVKVLLRYTQQDWESFDPITLKQIQRKGVEPDHCFYIQNRTAILGKEQIDLTVDPPPDLALEVDLTSLTQAEDYEEIGVAELWIYRRDTLHIYHFDDQHYQEKQTSSLFPTIPVKQLIPQYVEQAWSQGSSVALRAFEEAISRHYSSSR